MSVSVCSQIRMLVFEKCSMCVHLNACIVVCVCVYVHTGGCVSVHASH